MLKEILLPVADPPAARGVVMNSRINFLCSSFTTWHKGAQSISYQEIAEGRHDRLAPVQVPAGLDEKTDPKSVELSVNVEELPDPRAMQGL